MLDINKKILIQNSSNLDQDNGPTIGFDCFLSSSHVQDEIHMCITQNYDQRYTIEHFVPRAYAHGHVSCLKSHQNIGFTTLPNPIL